MRTLDPIIETAIGTHARENRAIVFLDRAAWMLGEAIVSLGTPLSPGAWETVKSKELERSIRDPAANDLESIHTTIEILRGATAQAAHDLAAHVCDRAKGTE